MTTICLDPGHGGADPGAVRAGIAEKSLALEIALAARQVLAGKHRVALTRTRDAIVTLDERRLIADRTAADLFVSIHVNAATRTDARGYEAVVRRGASPLSLGLAAAILVQFSHRWPGRRHRGIKTAWLAVLRQARPACLIECFFLSNPTERATMTRPEALRSLGEGIAWGCSNFTLLSTAVAVSDEEKRPRASRPRRRSPRPAP